MLSLSRSGMAVGGCTSVADGCSCWEGWSCANCAIKLAGAWAGDSDRDHHQFWFVSCEEVAEVLQRDVVADQVQTRSKGEQIEKQSACERQP